LKTIITEKAVFGVTPTGLVLEEIVAGLTPDELRAMTEADFVVSPDLCEYRLAG
jgi:acetate CoA/acetoacetate CoA-transferase beta subunit